MQKQLPFGEPVGIWIVREGAAVVVIGKAGRAVSLEVYPRKRQVLWSTQLPEVRQVSNYVEAADILIAGDGCERLAVLRLSEPQLQDPDCKRCIDNTGFLNPTNQSTYCGHCLRVGTSPASRVGRVAGDWNLFGAKHCVMPQVCAGWSALRCNRRNG